MNQKLCKFDNSLNFFVYLQVLIPPKGLLQKLKKEAENSREVLDQVLYISAHFVIYILLLSKYFPIFYNLLYLHVVFTCFYDYRELLIMNNTLNNIIVLLKLCIST